MNKGANIIAVAAAGFIAGMLLAPKSGKETRHDLKTKALDAKKVAGIKAEDIKHAMKAGAHTLHHSVKEAGEEMSDLADSAKYKAGHVVEDAQTNLSDDVVVGAGKHGK